MSFVATAGGCLSTGGLPRKYSLCAGVPDVHNIFYIYCTRVFLLVAGVWLSSPPPHGCARSLTSRVILPDKPKTRSSLDPALPFFSLRGWRAYRSARPG